MGCTRNGTRSDIALTPGNAITLPPKIDIYLTIPAKVGFAGLILRFIFVGSSERRDFVGGLIIAEATTMSQFIYRAAEYSSDCQLMAEVAYQVKDRGDYHA